MEFTYSPPPYNASRGLRREIQFEARIRVAIHGDEVVITANPEGLLLLAKHLITLAQPEVPDGCHFHYDAGDDLLDESANLVIERDRRC